MLQLGAGVGEFAYVQAHDTFVDTPVSTELGVALKVAISGATAEATTVTVFCAMSEPAELVQVRVKVVSAVMLMLVVSPFATAPTP